MGVYSIIKSTDQKNTNIIYDKESGVGDWRRGVEGDGRECFRL